jgi:hypothetical protein
MKIILRNTLVIFGIALFLFVSTSDQAFARSRRSSASSSMGRQSSQDESSAYQRGIAGEAANGEAQVTGWALGVSTLNLAGPMTLGGGAPIVGGLTFIFSPSVEDSIQGVFNLSNSYGSTSSNVNNNFGAGLNYKRTVASHGAVGFHLGLGLGYGRTGSASNGSVGSYTVSALGGVHFEIPGLSRLKIHFDGGPSYSWSTDSRQPASLTFSSFNPIGLGMSIAYLF